MSKKEYKISRCGISDNSELFNCPSCGKKEIRKGYNYCPICSQKIIFD